MSLSDGKGNVIITCQECDRILITIEVGKATFHGGMSVLCTVCEVMRSKRRMGGFG